MNGEEQEPLIEVGDSTPTIHDQAKAHGWECEIFSFNKAEQPGCEYFNPGLVRRPDGLWLLVRRSEQQQGLPYGMNSIWACKLVGDRERTPLGGPFLKFPDSKFDEQFEDPRAVYFNGQTWVGCTNFTWFPGGGMWWTGAHQVVGIFGDDDQWAPIARRDPVVGTNRGTAGHTDGNHNKNLLWWFNEGKLYCLYHSNPWHVVEFGSKWDEQIHHKGEGVKWNYGHVRGGTPPILVGDLFYTFFHSSLHWRGRYRRYFMGAMAFESKPPFKPVLVTREPILTASQNNPWGQGKPLVVFPCGSIYENSRWTVSLGVNDLKSAWFEIPHADLVELLKPIPVMQASLLLSDKTEIPVFDRIQYQLVNSVENDDPLFNRTETWRHQGPTILEQVIQMEKDALDNSLNEVMLPQKKPRGRPRKDGLPAGSVPPKQKRKYRRRKKKKANFSDKIG